MRPAAAEFADDGVDVLLRGYNDPCSSRANTPEVLSNCLQRKHQAIVTANKLSDLIDKKNDSTSGTLVVQILLNSVGESVNS